MIERAVILSSGPDLDLPSALIPASAVAPGSPSFQAPPGAESVSASTSASRSLGETEKEQIIAVLKQTNWRIAGPSGAAAILKINPSTLRSRIKKLGVKRSRENVS